MNKIIETMKQNPLPLNYPKLPYILMETIRTVWNNEYVAKGDGLLTVTNGVYCGEIFEEIVQDTDHTSEFFLLYSLAPYKYVRDSEGESFIYPPVIIDLQSSLIRKYSDGSIKVSRGVKDFEIKNYSDIPDILSVIRRCLDDALISNKDLELGRWFVESEDISKVQKSLKERILNEVLNA